MMVLFAEWLLELDQQMAAKGRKILLLLDNCSAHRVNPRLTNIEMLYLPPNCASKAQPLDMGVIANFKVCYKRRVIRWLILSLGQNPTASDPQPMKIYPAMAVQMTYGAWHEVKSQIIRNCFVKAEALVPDENAAPCDARASTEELEAA